MSRTIFYVIAEEPRRKGDSGAHAAGTRLSLDLRRRAGLDHWGFGNKGF